MTIYGFRKTIKFHGLYLRQRSGEMNPLLVMKFRTHEEHEPYLVSKNNSGSVIKLEEKGPICRICFAVNGKGVHFYLNIRMRKRFSNVIVRTSIYTILIIKYKSDIKRREMYVYDTSTFLAL